MPKAIVHLSDLHYRQDRAEELDPVISALENDLRKQLEDTPIEDRYLVFSGDFVLRGEDATAYSSFLERFEPLFTDAGITRERRFCIPGNHDVSDSIIRPNQLEHEGVVSLKLEELDFIEYFNRPAANFFFDKFDNYLKSIPTFAAHTVTKESLCGFGGSIDPNIAVYCLNTALLSSGGTKNKTGARYDDFERLAIETRALQEWITQNGAKYKILVMHHPKDWLLDWAKRRLKILIDKHFNLCLWGHTHEQDAYFDIIPRKGVVSCCAPPLFTSTAERLGYMIASVCPQNGVLQLKYREWASDQEFHNGINFARDDEGIIAIAEKAKKKKGRVPTAVASAKRPSVQQILQTHLDKVRESFSHQPRVWTDPQLMQEHEGNSDVEEEAAPIHIEEFINETDCAVIKAPPLFGSTTCARFLALKAWELNSGGLWLYVGLRSLKLHDIQKQIVREATLYGCEESDIQCLLIDDFDPNEKHAVRKVNRIRELYPDMRLVLMYSIALSTIEPDTDHEQLQGTFAVYYLWTLTQNKIRSIVTDYNKERYIADDDKLVKRVVHDLRVLNLPRTPFYCLTLLRASEGNFDVNPINRTEVLGRLLHGLFNMDEATYSSAPDLKDIEAVAGRFCEELMRSKHYYFSKESFLTVSRNFLSEYVVAIDAHSVFELLLSYQIVVPSGDRYCFRFAFWIYYFAAHRMHHSKDFCAYVFKDLRYASAPELIEFYTGIDRKREDALEILIRDLEQVSSVVQSKLNIPDEFNLYKWGQWIPAGTALEKMNEELAECIKGSNLPTEIKDQYQDGFYDRKRQYDQSMGQFFAEYSIDALIKTSRAASLALRNSDIVNPEAKRLLLHLVIKSWHQMTNLLIALAPRLAEEGNAGFDGWGCHLKGNFGDTVEERVNKIYNVAPYNILRWYKDDLLSQKMGPLLIDRFNDEENALRKHLLALVLIAERPNGWRDTIQGYIVSIAKNSFYLYDCYNSLHRERLYSFGSKRELDDLTYLMAASLAKHDTGSRNPKDSLIAAATKVLPTLPQPSNFGE